MASQKSKKLQQGGWVIHFQYNVEISFVLDVRSRSFHTKDTSKFKSLAADIG